VSDQPDKLNLDLLGKRILETQAEQRTIRTEMGLLRSQVAGLEGRLIDAFSDRISRFEVRMEDLFGRLLEEVRSAQRRSPD